MEKVKKLPYGYRGKLGLIVVGPNPTPREDVSRMVPEGVMVLETRIDMEPVVEIDVISKLSAQLPDAARILSQGKVDAIAIACTAGTTTGGPGHEQTEIKGMSEKSNGIPCTTVINSVMNAFSFMGVKKLVLASPYIDSINEKFVSYLKHFGYEVVEVANLGVTDSYELASVPSNNIYSMAKKVARKDVDGIFLPCTTFPVIDVIDEIEKDTGLKTISSNQALAWNMLRIIGISEKIYGFGKLLELPDRTDFNNNSEKESEV